MRTRPPNVRRNFSAYSSTERWKNGHEKPAEGILETSDARSHFSMIARECGLSDEEISRAMNCGTAAVVAFAKKHNISLDWLVCGDLKGLLRTVRAKQQSA